jgi:hypothetical protein
MSGDGGFSLRDVVRDSGPVQQVRNVLGIGVEGHTCQKCGDPCEPSTTYDSRTVAFHGGETPSWYCEACDTHYYRESTDELFTMDLYGQDNE